MSRLPSLLVALSGRLLALAGLGLILYGPARAFLTLDRLPLLLRLAWPCALLAAVAWPRGSLLAFLAGAALLPALTLIRNWPPVPLGEMWLLALLVPALARVAFGGWKAGAAGAPLAASRDTDMARRGADVRPSTVPAAPLAGLFLALVATCSLVVTLYPYQLAAGGVRPLIGDIATFWREDLLFAFSQRHLYASIPAWVTIVEGVALLWLLHGTFRDASTGPARDARQAPPWMTDAPPANAAPANAVPSGSPLSQLVMANSGLWLACVALCAGAVCVAVLGIYQWLTGAWLLPFWRVMDPNITRINASFSDVNAAGAYFALMLVPVWAMAGWPPAGGAPFAGSGRSADGRAGALWLWGWRAGAVLVALALLFTASRSAWGGALVGMVAFALLRRARRTVESGMGWRGWRAPLAVALALVVALAAASAYATLRDVRHANQETYLHTVLYTLNMRLSLDERFKGRLAFWDAALRMMAERPLAGVGIGRFYKLVPKYLEDAGHPVVQENAHNYFLQVGAELGLLGLVSLVGLLGTAGVLAIRASSDSESLPVAAMSAAVAAGVAAFAVTCVTGHALLLREGQVTFWPVAGLAWLLPTRVARGRVSSQIGEISFCSDPFMSLEPRTRTRNWPRPRTVLATGAVLALVASVPFRAAGEMALLDLARMPGGLLAMERAPDGSAFQWTTGHATIYVPRTATTVVLPVRSLAPTPQTLTLTRDGRPVDRLLLADHAWHELRYVLRDSGSDERFHRFDLRVTPTWHPPNDERELGVMLGRYRWTPER